MESKDAVWVNQVFQKGKTFYEAGNYSSALREWKQLDPYLDQYPSFKKVIGYLRNQVDSNAQTQASEPMDSSIRVAIQTGRVAYENGDWKKALEAWSRVERYLDSSSEDYAKLQKLKRDYETAQLTKKQSMENGGQATPVVQIPSKFGGYLDDASDRLQKQILEVQARQDNLEKEAVFEEAWIETTFSRGKDAFEAGNYDLAVEEWGKIAFKMKDDTAFASAIEQLKQARRAFRESELRYSESAGAAGESQQPANERIKSFLNQAASELKTKADEVSRQSMEKQQSTADLQKQVDQTFEKGREFFQKGRFKEAVDEWLMLRPRFEGDLVTKAAFLSAEGGLRSYELATSTYQGSVDSGAYKLRLPDGFFRYVENATHELAEKAGQTDAERQKTQAAVTAKRAEMISAFEKGKEYYALGRIADAAAEWKKIVPWVEGGEALDVELGKLEANAREGERQAAALKEARAKSAGAYTSPAELSQMLLTANQELKNQTQSATNERILVSQNLSQKQAAASNYIYKAGLVYKAGKTDQAIAEWEKLIPYLDANGQEKALIEELRRNYDEYQKADLANRESAARKNDKAEIPAELKKTLADKNEALVRQATDARAQLQVNQMDVNQRRTAINSALEKVRMFYQAGHYEDALAELQKLTPYMDPASPDKILIENLNQNQLDAKEATKQLSAAIKKSNVHAVLPDDLKKSLAQTNQELLQKSDQSWKESKKLEVQTTEDITAIGNATEKGRMFLQAGRLDQALEEWQKLIPYMDSASSDKMLLDNLIQNQQDTKEAAKQLSASAQKSGIHAEFPDDLKKSLAQTNQELIQKTSQAKTERQMLETQSTERRAAVTSALEKGRLFHQADRLDQASAEWEKLLPYLDSSSEAYVLIEQFKQNYTDLALSSALYKESLAKKDIKANIPVEVKQLLTKTSLDLAKQTDRMNMERSERESDRQRVESAVSSSLERVRLFQQSGRLDQALAEWQKLLPYIDSVSEEHAQIEQFSQTYTDYLKADARRKETLSKKEIRAEIPQDIKQLLVQTNQELLKKTEGLRVERDNKESDRKKIEAIVSSALEKGKLYYQTSRLDQAISEWEKLIPYFDSASEEKLLIENLRQSYREFDKASSRLKETVSQSEVKIAVPADLPKVLSATTQDLIAKANDLRAERQGLETKISDRQTWAFSILEKAAVYSKAGRVAEALEEWKKVADILEDGTGSTKAALRDLETSLAQYGAVQQALKDTLPKKDAKLPMPAELSSLIGDLKTKILEDTQSTQFSMAQLEKEVADRQMFVEKTFAQGKKLISEGKPLEAVYEWDNLLPYLDEKSGVPQLLLDVKKQWQALQDAKKSNELFITTRYKDNTMPFTGELQKFLTGLDVEFQKSHADSQATRAQMEKALAERRAWVSSTFEKGKAYYGVGKYKEAIEFWLTLSPNLKEDPVVQSYLTGLPQKYEAMILAEKAAQEAKLQKDAPIEVPAGMTEAMTAAAQKLSLISTDAMSRAEKARAEGDAKIAAMNQLFNEGKAFAEKGQWEAAVKAWSGLPPYLVNGDIIKAAVDNLAASFQNYTKTLADAQQLEARLSARLTEPTDLSQMLSDAAFKLDKERQSTELARERTEKILAEKQTAVDKLYSDGKAFYDQGKLPDAFSAWRSLLPSVDNQKSLEELLGKADQSYQMYVASKEQNQQSMARKELKLDAPVELSQLLEAVNQQLRDQVFDLKSRVSQTEKMLGDRKDWIDVTFKKGRLAYSQGRYQEAVAEWKTLLPFVENGSALENGISDFERNLQVSLESSKTNMEAEAKKNMKFPAPDEFGVLLVQLNEKVKNEALEAGAEKIRADQQYSERQKWLKQTFELGRSFYLEGKYDQAITEWEKLAPYLEAQTGTLQLIDTVKQGYRDSLEAKKGAVEAAAGDYQGLKLPYSDQMTKLLGDADSKLKEEVAAARTKTGEMQKTLAERQEWSMTTFNKGKVLFDQERYEEALGQWERLAPYLAEGSEIKKQISSLRESLNIIAAGNSSNEEPPVKLRNEEEILGVLNTANQHFKTEADNKLAKQREAQQSLDQRKQWMEATFQKGKTFYDQNNYAKAVEEWGVLGPYLGEHPKIREMIEEAKKSYSEGRYAQQIIESMEAKISALAPLPTTSPISAPEKNEPQEDSGTVRTASEELISGEIVSIDEPARTITMKLFTESGENETLTVNFDEHTKVDGSDIKTLSNVQNGGSIDVRYNPQTSRANYIYVY